MKTADTTNQSNVPKRTNAEIDQLNDSDDVEKLLSVLADDEAVDRLVLCFHEESDAVLAATNKRLVFADKQFLGSKVAYFDYDEIATVIYAAHLVTHEITIAYRDGSLTVTKVDKNHGERFVEYLSTRIGKNFESSAAGHVMKHRGDMLEMSDLPSMDEDEATL